MKLSSTGCKLKFGSSLKEAIATRLALPPICSNPMFEQKLIEQLSFVYAWV